MSRLRPSSPTVDTPCAPAARVLALWHDIHAGTAGAHGPWIEFALGARDYETLLERAQHDTKLRGAGHQTIRYDYDAERRQLAVRLSSPVHAAFVARVQDAVAAQLAALSNGRGDAAAFCQRVVPARRSDVHFPAANDAPGRESRHEPDAAFWHAACQYPGVILEVVHAGKRERLAQLAEDYLLDSDCGVQAVVGLDVEYGTLGARTATVSVWRAREFPTAAGHELRVVKDVADEADCGLHAFRDHNGNPTDAPGLRLRLSDFAYKELARKELHGQDQDIGVSSRQLCALLAAAEATA